MVGTSKILTVSYGTFSCTLEGFDDSFGTMKAIAEYFRGLAADDRYFGAEPPTPDAEMLAKIAEREISRRVDARMEDSGIVLRASALTDQSEPDTAAQEDDTEAAEKAARKAERKERKARQKAERRAAEKAKREKEEEARAEAEAKEKARAEEAQAEADKRAAEEAEKQAEEEARAEAEAQETARLAALEAEQEEARAHAEQEAAELKAAADRARAEEEDRARAQALAEERAPKDDVDAADDAADGAEDTEQEIETATDDESDEDNVQIAPVAPTVPSHPDANSVAAKLQRIRAVVGSGGANASVEQQIPPHTQAPDISEDPSEDADKDDVISRVLTRRSTPEHSAANAPKDVDEASDNATPDASRPRVVRMKRAEFEEAKRLAEEGATRPAPTSAPATPDLGLLDGADDLSEYLEDSDFENVESPEIDLDDDLAEDLSAIQGAEAAAETAEDDDYEEDDLADEGNAITSTVARAMAQTREDDEDTEDDFVENNAADDITADMAEADASEVDDAALDRLMSETDAQMNQPENSRRRDAIAQLKAAVAAKEAARQVGEDDEDDHEVENAFRNDLSEAVRPEGGGPSRPVMQGKSRTERPRPAPLKLVAAQRVDLPTSEPRDTPVIPRRVSAKRAEPASDASNSFAEFVREAGAAELPDLIEAAAAYTSFVEGAEEFSRPQLLRRVRSVTAEEFNREDGLRSFAALLKSGRFTKIRNGRFQIADDTRFKPDQMAG